MDRSQRNNYVTQTQKRGWEASKSGCMTAITNIKNKNQIKSRLQIHVNTFTVNLQNQLTDFKLKLLLIIIPIETIGLLYDQLFCVKRLKTSD